MGMVKVTARVAGSTMGIYGLVFAGRETPQELLVFWVDPVTQRYALQQLKGGAWTVLVDWSASSAIRTGNQTNLLAVRQNGEEIHLYVNDAYLDSVFDPAAADSTEVGLVHWAFYGGWATAHFDDFATTVPTVAYEDDFSSASSGWWVGSEAEFEAAYDNGEYRITSAAGSACIISAPCYPLPDGIVEVQVRRGESLYPSTYGVAFAVDSEVEHFYALWVWPDSQQFSLFKYEPEGQYPLMPHTWTAVIKPGQANNLISLVRDRARIEVYLNEVHVATVDDDSFLENGYFGLLHYALPYAPATAFFDDIRVTIWDVPPWQSSPPMGTDRAPVMHLPVPEELLHPLATDASGDG
jgi:hypothetical protein